jgi:DNA-directed RNA polymerase specialized sigma24 family protein
LKAWGSGDEAALVRLTEHVYPELRLMARRYMKDEAQGNTLQATALVHEVYLRLVDVTTSNGMRVRSSLPSRPR